MIYCKQKRYITIDFFANVCYNDSKGVNFAF